MTSSLAVRLPRLHVVTSTDVLERPDFEEQARAVIESAGEVEGGSVALHLRGRIGGGPLHALALRLRGSTRDAGVALWINDRVDVARTAGADGVQLPAHGLSPDAVRRALGPTATIGASVHDAEQADRAGEADLWIVGNVWTTPSHPGRAGAGPEWVRRMVDRSGAPPVIAIGGVTPARVAEAVEAGAHGVAVLGGVWGAEAPERAVIHYLEALAADPFSDADR